MNIDLLNKFPNYIQKRLEVIIDASNDFNEPINEESLKTFYNLSKLVSFKD